MLLHSAACCSSAWVLKDCIHPFCHIVMGEPYIKLVLGWDISRIFPELVFSRIQSIFWKRQPTFCSSRIHFVQIGFVFQLMQITLHDYLSPLIVSLFLCSYLLAVLQLRLGHQGVCWIFHTSRIPKTLLLLSDGCFSSCVSVNLFNMYLTDMEL